MSEEVKKYLQSKVDESSKAGDFIVNSFIQRWAPEECVIKLMKADSSGISDEERTITKNEALLIWNNEIILNKSYSEQELDTFTNHLIENKPKKFKSINKKYWKEMIGWANLAYGPNTYGNNTK